MATREETKGRTQVEENVGPETPVQVGALPKKKSDSGGHAMSVNVPIEEPQGPKSRRGQVAILAGLVAIVVFWGVIAAQDQEWLTDKIKGFAEAGVALFGIGATFVKWTNKEKYVWRLEPKGAAFLTLLLFCLVVVIHCGRASETRELTAKAEAKTAKEEAQADRDRASQEIARVKKSEKDILAASKTIENLVSSVKAALGSSDDKAGALYQLSQLQESLGQAGSARNKKGSGVLGALSQLDGKLPTSRKIASRLTSDTSFVGKITEAATVTKTGIEDAVAGGSAGVLAILSRKFPALKADPISARGLVTAMKGDEDFEDVIAGAVGKASVSFDVSKLKPVFRTVITEFVDSVSQKLAAQAVATGNLSVAICNDKKLFKKVREVVAGGCKVSLETKDAGPD